MRECDFLGEEDAWKLEWTKTTRPHEWLYVFPGALRSSLLHAVKFRRRELTGLFAGPGGAKSRNGVTACQ
jgi:hypothetical protein